MASDNSKQQKAMMTHSDIWSTLRRFTEARIGLGRSGCSMPTQAQLAFQLAHAKAKDAVHIPLDIGLIEQQLTELRLASVYLHSEAVDRVTYLQRPDKGRRLNSESAACLNEFTKNKAAADATIVLADGLSSTAIQKHGVATSHLIAQMLESLGLSFGPVGIVEQGRVAIGDEIGQILDCRLMILLIGERPGLSSPDSLGIYYTYQPQVGLTDERRNCISNIREGGLSPAKAVKRLEWLIKESELKKLSGVTLKDKSDEQSAIAHLGDNFLLD